MKTYLTAIAWILFLLAALLVVGVAYKGTYHADSFMAFALLVIGGILSARQAETLKQ